MRFTLTCPPCGRDVHVDGADPRSAENPLDAAAAAGWIGVLDRHSRTAVFCSKECRDAATQRDGTLRADLGKDLLLTAAASPLVA